MGIPFNANITSFLTFVLIKFLVQSIKCTETLILYICFAHLNMKNLSSKVGYFSKIKKNLSSDLTAKSAPKQKKKYMNYLSFYTTWQIQLWRRAHNNNLKGEEKVGIYYFTFITKMQTEASMKLMENFRMLQTCRWTLMKSSSLKNLKRV